MSLWSMNVTVRARTPKIVPEPAQAVNTLLDQSDISNADVPVWTGPGCVFNDQVLSLYTGYTGNEAAFLTWASANGNRVGSQGGSY